MPLNDWLSKFRAKVPAHEKEELRLMQEETSRQKSEATGLLHEARLTGQKLAASRQRNHYRIILDEILGGNP
jgi:hypothetical protein